MGSNSSDEDSKSHELPQHEVTLTKSFYLSETEVTQSQWEKVMGADSWKQNSAYGDDGPYGEGPNYPVYYVSFNDVLKFLEKIGRKKIVLDRGPSHPEYEKAKPWMNRYYLIFRHRPKWFPFNILIHEMLADDHGEGVHNHTFPYITIVLRDGYWETLKTGKFWRSPGYIGFRSANNLHRVDLKPGTKPLTIFISGPYGLRKGKRSEYGIDFQNK